MKRIISRNIAVVTALFIACLTVMLLVSWYQARQSTPLQAAVVETLKQLNDAQAGNAALQEQIRQLDLLSRKAYFVQQEQLVSGIHILLGLWIVLIISLRVHYAGTRHIPDKELDPIDEWAVKSNARRYLAWGGSVLALAALTIALLTAPYLRSVPDTGGDPETVSLSVAADTQDQTAAPPAGVSHSGFRGNTGTGISAARNIPVRWDLPGGAHIAWKQPVTRGGYNSPVISGNRVFYTGADEEARELFCHDLATGALLWSLKAADIPGSPAAMPATTEDTGLAASTVATNGQQVCAVFATGDMLCASVGGQRLWAKNLGVPDNHYGYASSLLIQGNQVIVQYDNANDPRVFALDLATGAERWSTARTAKVTWSSPILAETPEGPRLVLMGNPAIEAYDPATGRSLWQVNCLSGEVGASACYADGRVFGASEYAKLVAIRIADGSVEWESTEYLPEVASPVATPDNLYLATSYGMVVSYDARTGELRKEHELDGEFYSSPVIADGRVYLFSNDGKMHVFSADDDFELLEAFETGEKTWATPAFTDGRLVVRTEKSIYCVTTDK